jgi:L-rhamnose mutarotase
MRTHLKRLAAVALPVLLGIAIGLAWGQARPSARAEGPAGQAKPCKVQRFGSVIGLRPEKKDYYLKLHANVWPSVLKQIRGSNIRNYSIYLAELEGKLYLFSYFEYVGDDFKADMAKMAEDPETRRWWKETDPCQSRLPGTPESEQWLKIPEVFHTD